MGWWLEARDIPSVSPDGAAVHAVGLDGVLRGYDADSGAVRWEARAPEGRFAREEAYGDDVVVLYGDESASVGICRIGADGVRRWCTGLGRPLSGIDIGLAGTGLAVPDRHESRRVLDAETGAPLGDWLLGGEMHIYSALDQPHDTRFYPAAAVLGRFGQITAIADPKGVRGLLPDGRVRWERALSVSSFALRAGRGGIAFVRRGEGIADLWRVGDALLAIDPVAGEPGWQVILPEAGGARLVEGGFLVGDEAVTSVDPDSGTVRWRRSVDGIGAIVGERGPIGRRAPDGPADVVWIDGRSGREAGRTPLGSASGALWAAPCGLVVGPGPHGWSCLAPGGAPRWSFDGPVLGAEVRGEIGVLYRKEQPVTLVRLETGQVFGTLEGSLLDAAGSTAILSRGEPNRYAVDASFESDRR